MTLDEVIKFIQYSNCVTISLKEGGYKIIAHTAENHKWDSPFLYIDVTDYDIPTREFSAEVEFRKEKALFTDKKKEVEKIKKVTHDRYNELILKREKDLKKDFDRILRDMSNVRKQ